MPSLMSLEEKKLNMWLTLRKANALVSRLRKVTSHGDLDEFYTNNIEIVEALDDELPAIIAEMEQDPLVAAAKASLKNPA